MTELCPARTPSGQVEFLPGWDGMDDCSMVSCSVEPGVLVHSQISLSAGQVLYINTRFCLLNLLNFQFRVIEHRIYHVASAGVWSTAWLGLNPRIGQTEDAETGLPKQ